jgi:3-oxoacyl-[acyl-carrier-protein] synthase I
MTPIAITAMSLVSALGEGLQAHGAALREGRSGLARQDFLQHRLDTWLGLVPGLEDQPWPANARGFDCRNNRLAERALQGDGFAARVAAVAERVGPRRVAVLLGTSTSGILSTEQAYARRAADGALPPGTPYEGTHDLFSVAAYVRQRLGLLGPSQVVSTACSSSAKVFATAARMLQLGWIDAAVVGGVDSLCGTTLHGFKSLELLSPEVCRPWDAQRAGLSLGEAAALLLLERAPGGQATGWLLGAGESSDAHHMSSPHPQGEGAAAAMRAALREAGLQPGQVHYVNLHGTGTRGNDAAEDAAVCAVFGRDMPCSSTKGYTGHTLGAAGAVEAVLSLLALQQGVAPAGLHVREPDPQLSARYLTQPQRLDLRVVASNSFGFGGTNACLVLGVEA